MGRANVLPTRGALVLAAVAPAFGCDYDADEAATTDVESSRPAGGSGGQDTTSAPSVVATVGAVPDCDDAAACGGDVVGTWNVASTCLALDGDMDVFLTSLACATVPVQGVLEASGTLVFRDDGTYADNTTTTGSVTFPLDSTCLAISGVGVECERVGPIFNAVGWTDASCAVSDGECSCALSTTQMGGLGQVLSFTEPASTYTTSGDTLSAANATYSYCAMGDTLTLAPDMGGLTGSVRLQRAGTVVEGGVVEGAPVDVTGSGGSMSTGGGMAGAAGMDGAAGAPMDGEDTPLVGERPCDIYAAAGQSCVAAHSTVRALFAGYDGPLYQLTRADGATADVPLQRVGGFANSAVQDTFCANTSCTITILYDQSGSGNFLEAQTPGSSVGGFQNQTAANANAERLTVGGNPVYSLFTRPAQAYWNDGSENGMPLGAEPQGIYMVTSGVHYNGGCCYNYGNGQLDRTYSGGPTMDAVYFGNNRIWGTGAGNGPWVMADMEDGMLAWGNGGNNPNSPSLPFPYVTAIEKNDGSSTFALKGGNATQPNLTTMWDGDLPNSRSPMRKEGGVILGAGGDCCYSNNNASEGTFYEGAIVAGYPSDATDEAIHANIVETGYGQ